MENSQNCGCNASNACVGCVGYAYVPVQEMDETYCPLTGLMQGTIFPELDLNINEYGKVCKQWRGDE